MAQSLDLPPSAAHWRHQQRSQQQMRAQQRQRRSHFDLSLVSVAAMSQAAAEGGSGVVRDESRDLRSRVAGMLEQERSDMWDDDYDNDSDGQ